MLLVKILLIGLYFCIQMFFVQTSYELTITSISYPKWYDTTQYCPGMIVRYRLNSSLINTTQIILKLYAYSEHISGVDESDEYECETIGLNGHCVIQWTIINDYNLTLSLYAQSSGNGSQLLLQKKSLVTNMPDVYGPFDITIEKIMATSVRFVWFRPWLSYCGMPTLINCLQETCLSTDDNSFCGQSGVSRLGQVVQCKGGKGHEPTNCSRSITDLKPATSYKYRIRYSYGVVSCNWAAWSNELFFVTKSNVPLYSPSITCLSEDDSVTARWRVSRSDDKVLLTHFKVIVGGKIFKNVSYFDDQQEYSSTIQTQENVVVVVQSCAESGCAKIGDDNECKQGALKKSTWYLYVAIPSACLAVAFVVLCAVVKLKRCTFSTSVTNDLISPRFPRPSVTSETQLTWPTSFSAVCIDDAIEEYIIDDSNRL